MSLTAVGKSSQKIPFSQLFDLITALLHCIKSVRVIVVKVIPQTNYNYTLFDQYYKVNKITENVCKHAPTLTNYVQTVFQ